MNRTRVTSSNIESIGYDASVKTLEVEFKNQSVYQYLEVDFDTYTRMMAAESQGKFLNSQIKPTYEFVKVRDGVPTKKAE